MAFPDPITSVASAGMNLLGGILQNNANQEMQEQAMSFNADQAYQNRAWQEKMANTRYEMAIGDLRHMKMNPILALGGQPPGAGGGDSASISPAHMENVLGPAVNTALEASKLRTALENTESQTELNEEIEDTNKTQQEKNRADAAVSAAQALKIQTETELLKKDIPGAKMKSEIGKWISDRIHSYQENSAKNMKNIEQQGKDALKTFDEWKSKILP